MPRNVEKYLLNRDMRFGIRAGYAPRFFALAEMTGATAGWGPNGVIFRAIGSTPLTLRMHSPGFP